TVLVAFNGEHETESADQENDGGHAGAGAHDLVDAGAQAPQRSDHGGDHGEREQPVCIAQYLVACGFGLSTAVASLTRERLPEVLHRTNLYWMRARICAP